MTAPSPMRLRWADMLGSFALFGLFGRGLSVFPSVEPEFMQVQVRARDSFSIWERDALGREVENRLLGHDGIASVYARSTMSPGQADEETIGTLQLDLVDGDRRETAVWIGARTIVNNFTNNAVAVHSVVAGATEVLGPNDAEVMRGGAPGRPSKPTKWLGGTWSFPWVTAKRNSKSNSSPGRAKRKRSTSTGKASLRSAGPKTWRKSRMPAMSEDGSEPFSNTRGETCSLARSRGLRQGDSHARTLPLTSAPPRPRCPRTRL